MSSKEKPEKKDQKWAHVCRKTARAITAQNHTGESPFLLLGLSDDPQLQPILFGLFLSMYLITVLGNLLIILAVISDPHLHTPMYFFLSNMSFVDICFTTTTIPKMLVNIQTQRKDISYPECLTQVYLFMIFGGMENFLLTVMAYDRFVAICHPLNYPVIMNPHFCDLLVPVSWFLINDICVYLAFVLFGTPCTEIFPTNAPIPETDAHSMDCTQQEDNSILLHGEHSLHQENRKTARAMAAQNHTGESQFLLLGLSDDPQLQPLLFGIFLSMYLITVLGNLLIILAVTSDPHLHTPMYFFLSNLSFVDICFTSTTVPKMLVDIQTQRKDISYPECLTQVYFFMIFVGMENFLLTVMAYDRFVAICHPLNYPVIMNPHFCGLLVLVSWLFIFCISLHHILLMRKLTFSPGTTIPHFFCELAQVLQVASSDTLINDIWMYLDFVLFCVFPALGIFFSYHQILSSLMKLPNTASKHKAFSTCGSHLCVVSLFYGTGLGVYLSSAVSASAHRSKVASVMYTVVTPMLNPFIYSLRNQDVMGALGRLPGRVVSCLDGL
ncbi:olfactory receptor 7D4-like [Thomomys bottae]